MIDLEKLTNCKGEQRDEKHYGVDIKNGIEHDEIPTAYELYEIALLKKGKMGLDDEVRTAATPAELFGNTIKKLRYREDLSIKEFCKRTKLSRERILKLEYGCLTIDELADISSAISSGLNIQEELLFKIFLKCIK